MSLELESIYNLLLPGALLVFLISQVFLRFLLSLNICSAFLSPMTSFLCLLTVHLASPAFLATTWHFDKLSPTDNVWVFHVSQQIPKGGNLIAWLIFLHASSCPNSPEKHLPSYHQGHTDELSWEIPVRNSGLWYHSGPICPHLSTHSPLFPGDHVCVLVSRVWLCVIPWTIAHQVLLSMEFSRQEYWSR